MLIHYSKVIEDPPIRRKKCEEGDDCLVKVTLLPISRRRSTVENRPKSPLKAANVSKKAPFCQGRSVEFYRVYVLVFVREDLFCLACGSVTPIWVEDYFPAFHRIFHMDSLSHISKVITNMYHYKDDLKGQDLTQIFLILIFATRIQK